MMQHFFRPEWTCGRYNPEADTAIMYNLLNGVSSFFESYSARVIGEILSIPKNGRGTAEDIAEHTGIAVESITEFLQVLKENGLVSDRLLSREEITLMRRKQGEIFRSNPPKTDFGESTGQIDMIYAQKEALPESRHFVQINGTENLAQVFTRYRFTRKDNEEMSRKMLEVLKDQGFLDDLTQNDKVQ